MKKSYKRADREDTSEDEEEEDIYANSLIRGISVN
jgi:hypothetical protein